jgi:hypothetical protein
MNNYQSIFTDFDYDYIELGQQLGEGWSDETWGNNTCPSFAMYFGTPPAEEWYTLYFDYSDPELSEHVELRKTGDMKQYDLVDQFGNSVFSTDQWKLMLKAIKIDKVHEQHFNNTQEFRATDTDG